RVLGRQLGCLLCQIRRDGSATPDQGQRDVIVDIHEHATADGAVAAVHAAQWLDVHSLPSDVDGRPEPPVSCHQVPTLPKSPVTSALGRLTARARRFSARTVSMFLTKLSRSSDEMSTSASIRS